MTSDMDDNNASNTSTTNPVVRGNMSVKTWQLNALSEALGDLTLTITDSLSIGRGSDNDVVLGSKEVSRNHAVLSVANDQLYIKDLDSSNGTFINDERIAGNQSKDLKSADIVGFASFSFQVLAVADTAKEMLATDEDSMSPDASTTAEAISLATGAAATKSTISTGYKSKAPDGTININDVVDSNTANNVANISNTATNTDTKLPRSNEPVVKQTMISEVLATSDDTQPVSNSVTPLSTQTDSDEPIVKDTIIAEVLAAADRNDLNSTDALVGQDSSALDATSSQIPTSNAPTHEETVMSTEPSTDTVNSTTASEHATKRAPYHDDTVTPEHDKTTTTALQEEADPEVLRAKQAATAQFSGTANLGGSRDLGTTGNNAMNQSINSAAHTDKKPSGGWFIWVFVIILIIGIALWLFNMGGA
ncbi:FHA domain-containing protein [Psychrobacter sp. DM4]|uniref:FHA domain-containing protein n=1 Tax=Psychrobacter sp. DM4 TaxID=3440637 RepID=UPI003F4F6D95